MVTHPQAWAITHENKERVKVLGLHCLRNVHSVPVGQAGFLRLG